MKSLPVRPIPPEIVEKISHAITSGKSQEEVFAEMRRLGLFMTDSIKLTCQFFDMSPVQAKIAVHYSETWADCREANEALHESAFQAARVLESEETEPSQQENRQLQNVQ